MSELSSNPPSSPGLLKIDVGNVVPSVRPGVLFRTAWGLDPGLIATIGQSPLNIDLRHAAEKEPAELALDRARILDIPVHQGGVAEMLGLQPGRAEYSRVYGGILENCQPALAATLQAVAGSLAEGVVLGCSMGKDRTGVVIALILAAVGISDDEIVEAERAARNEVFQKAEQLPGDLGILGRAGILQRLRVAHESIGDCLVHCRSMNGSVPKYLEQIGVRAAALGQLRTLVAP